MKHAFVLSLYATMVKHPQWYQCGSSVAQLSPLFAATWIAVPQASLSLTVSRSLLKLMSTESLTPSNRLTFRRVEVQSKEKLSAVTGGMQLPPGFKMPF